MQSKLKEKFLELYETIGQRFFELTVNLLAMVIVARNLDLSAFGAFSYLVALFLITTFISEAGICDRFRNRSAQMINNKKDLQDSAGALFLTGIMTALIFLLTIIYKSSNARIDEHVIAYLLIAFAVPLSNGNRLRTTQLHITGKHREASRLLVKKHLLFLLLIWGLTMTQLPSLLIGAFLFSELYLRIALRKKVRMPKIFQPSFFQKAYQTIKKSLRHLFSGETLTLIFNTDFFILGLFVTSYKLGVYAEAALFGRFFLLVPFGIRPILHRHFSRIFATDNAHTFSKSVHGIRAYMFYFHAILAMVLTIFFDDTIHTFLKFYGSEKVSFDLFIILLPGFLFYAAAIVNETAMEASGNAPFLSRISAIIITINVLLSFYLIPFAGTLGAASATLVCLLIYFFTICTIRITSFTKTPILEFLTAGASVYLVEKLVVWLDLSLFLFMIVVPPVLYLIFYLLNFFDFDDYDSIAKPNLYIE